VRVATQRCGKHIVEAGNQYTMDGGVFSVGTAPRLCNEDLKQIELESQLREPRVEEGSNTSTVALRVVGGDKRKTQCLGL
jgi:hypothetical protein